MFRCESYSAKCHRFSRIKKREKQGLARFFTQQKLTSSPVAKKNSTKGEQDLMMMVRKTRKGYRGSGGKISENTENSKFRKPVKKR